MPQSRFAPPDRGMNIGPTNDVVCNVDSGFHWLICEHMISTHLDGGASPCGSNCYCPNPANRQFSCEQCGEIVLLRLAEARYEDIVHLMHVWEMEEDKFANHLDNVGPDLAWAYYELMDQLSHAIKPEGGKCEAIRCDKVDKGQEARVDHLKNMFSNMNMDIGHQERDELTVLMGGLNLELGSPQALVETLKKFKKNITGGR